jgi:hypothetical protein
MVKTPAVEIGPVVSFEVGAVVIEVDAVTVVAGPGGVVIVNIAGIFGFTHVRCGVVTAIVFGRIVYWCRCGGSINRSWCNIHPGAGDTKADVGVYVYLGVAFGSDEAGGNNGGEDHYLFHICRFLS